MKLLLNTISRLLNFKFSLVFVLSFYSIISFSYIKPGLWSTGCQLGQQKQQLITDDHVESRESFYQDRNCRDLSFEFNTSGFIHFDLQNTEHINFTYTNIYLTLFKEVLVTDFNSRKVCGLTNWKLADKINITGLNCALFNVNNPLPIPDEGMKKYGIYRVNNTELIYGQLSQPENGNTPEARPTKFNENLIYRFIVYTFQNSL